MSSLAAALALAAAVPAAAQVCPYQNLLPEFAEFVTATADLAPQERATEFVTRFAAKQADFYSEPMLGKTPFRGSCSWSTVAADLVVAVIAPSHHGRGRVPGPGHRLGS